MTFFIFLSLVVCLIMQMTILYHAQDNSLENVIRKLSENSVLLIKWFPNNKIKANPKKIRL